MQRKYTLKLGEKGKLHNTVQYTLDTGI